jgi:DNA-binding LytR/AlgR family response regulator
LRFRPACLLLDPAGHYFLGLTIETGYTNKVERVIKTLIVDDESIARQILREELALMPDVDLIGEADDGTEAVRKIADLQPDLVLLDLQMPQVDGFEVVRRLSGTPLPVIVIVTAFQKHAVDAFEAGAIDYLLKPVRADRLRKAVDRARLLLGKPREIARTLARIASVNDSREAASTRKMVGRIGRDYFLLDLNEVLALQAEGELVWIVTARRRFLASQTLRSVESTLDSAHFQRVHRNAIVNTNHVRQMTAITSHRWMLTLSNQQELVVSKRQAHNIRRLLQR